MECKLRFAGIHFSPGILAVDAVDKHSDEWLVEKVPRLAKWRWTELRESTPHTLSSSEALAETKLEQGIGDDEAPGFESEGG